MLCPFLLSVREKNAAIYFPRLSLFMFLCSYFQECIFRVNLNFNAWQLLKEIKYYLPFKAHGPHPSWWFHFQYLKCSTFFNALEDVLVSLLNALFHRRTKYHLSIYESLLSLFFTFPSLCVSSFYILLNYFWPNIRQLTWKLGSQLAMLIPLVPFVWEATGHIAPSISFFFFFFADSSDFNQEICNCCPFSSLHGHFVSVTNRGNISF